MEPHVHLRRIRHQRRRASQLRGQLLARRQTAVDLKELQQIDDGGPPVEFLRVRRRALLQLRDDVDEGDRLGRRRGRRRRTRVLGCGGGWRGGRGGGGRATDAEGL